MQDLYKLTELTDIKQLFNTQSDSSIQTQLIAEFNRLKDYKNAVEWNQLVMICEAITILDIWHKLELKPLEAYCGKGISGSWETSLMNANWEQQDGSWRDWSKNGDSFKIYQGEDTQNYGVLKLNSQRNIPPTNPFKIGRYIANCQQSVKAFVAEVDGLNACFEAQMKPKIYGDGFYYAQIYTNFSAHDYPSDSSVQSEYFHDEKDAPKDHDNFYIEPPLKFGKLSTRRDRLCWTVDRYYSRAWGEMPLAQQKQSLADDLNLIFAELDKKLTKKKVNYNVKLAIEHANIIINQWLNTTANAKFYKEIEIEFIDAKAQYEKIFN